MNNPLSTIGRGLLTGLRGVGKGALAGLDYAALGGDVGGLLSEVYPDGAPSSVKRALRQSWMSNFFNGMNSQASMPAMMNNYRENATNLLGTIYARRQAQQLQAERNAVMGGGTGADADTLERMGRLYIQRGDMDTGMKLIAQASAMRPKPEGEPLQVTKGNQQILVQRYSDGSMRPVTEYGPKADYTPQDTGGGIGWFNRNNPAAGPVSTVTKTLTPGEQQQGTQFNRTFDYNKGQDEIKNNLAQKQFDTNVFDQIWRRNQDLRKINYQQGQDAIQNGIAQGNLAVAQGNLGVAQGNLGVRQQELKNSEAAAAKPPLEALKRAQALAALNNELDAYERMISGQRVRGADGREGWDRKNALFESKMWATDDRAQKIGAQYGNLKIKLKEANALGALTGPDVAILEQQLMDPLSWQGRWVLGQTGLQSQIDTLKEGLRREAQTLLQTYYNQPYRNQPSYDALDQLILGGR